MPVYRYKLSGGYAPDLTNKVPGSPTLGSIGPSTYVDVTVGAGSKEDLDDYMASQSYTYVSTDPTTTPEAQASSNIVAGSDKQVQFNLSGVLGASANLTYDNTAHTLNINQAQVLSNNPLAIGGSVDAFLQLNIQNANAGTGASTDIVATNDLGTDGSHYIDIGINSSGYTESEYNITGPNDAYVLVADGHLAIGTETAAKIIKFHTGGATTDCLRATVDDDGVNLPAGKSFRINGASLPLLTSSAPADVDAAAAVVGVASTAARADHKHLVTTGTPNAVSVGGSAAEGSATSLARSDHQHGIAVGTPSSIGTSNTQGSASSVARSDHGHDHGSQSTGTHHAVVIANGANGFMSGTDKAKLDGIASGAVSDHGALSGLGDDDHSQYVLADGSRLFHGQRYFGRSVIDPTSPTPSDGDTYYNTVLGEVLYYDGTRSKWLSSTGLTFTAGRFGDTAAGSFYRGADGVTFGTNIGYPVPKGTLVGVAWSRTDSDTAILDVLVGGSVIASLTSSASGITENWAANADFNAGLLQFRNRFSGGNTTSNVQITAIIKRRI